MRRTLFWLLLSACAAAPVKAPPPPPPAPWSVPLVQGNLVQARVGTQSTLLVVDTAATRTTLFPWFSATLGEPGARELVVGDRLIGTAAWPAAGADGAWASRGVGGVLAPREAFDDAAVVIDFPGARVVTLGGTMGTWLQWLDERSPRGQVEALPRVGPQDGATYVKSKVGDGQDVLTTLCSSAPQSEYVSTLFGPELIRGGRVSGLHVRLGDSEFGPLTPTVTREKLDGPAQGSLGLDVLSGVVVLLPKNPNQPIWVMTPRQ